MGIQPLPFAAPRRQETSCLRRPSAVHCPKSGDVSSPISHLGQIPNGEEQSPTYPKCEVDEGTFFHFLGQCAVLGCLRHDVFDAVELRREKAGSLRWTDILTFIMRSGRFAQDQGRDGEGTMWSGRGRSQSCGLRKKSSIQEEEMLFINGIPVALEGRDGVAIKQALITGQVPPCDLLNTLLIKTGILKAPVKLDTSLSVKSTTVTKEEVTVSRAGKIVDERSRETKEQNFYSSAMTEVFEPIKVIPTSELLNGQYTNVKYAENYEKQPKFYDNNGYETESERKFGSCSSTSSYESEEPPMQAYQPKQCLSKDSGHLSNSMSTTKVDYTPSSIDSLSSLDETDYVANRFSKCSPYGRNGLPNGYQSNYLPTIFGTVASDLTPKDCSNRRSLPQTPQTKSFSTIFNGEAGQEGSAESVLQQEKLCLKLPNLNLPPGEEL
ncbi:hypothetical protein NQ317_009698 [Molorchus minor]|uniref:Uncharacterized protein n=1 Tax=Molorchus minor TaxID=1323400 RepID=A0ABQ9JGQ7_9CUCU|nr:hypothetical protein NQ317_009698 [Molorchus minor]